MLQTLMNILTKVIQFILPEFADRNKIKIKKCRWENIKPNLLMWSVAPKGKTLFRDSKMNYHVNLCSLHGSGENLKPHTIFVKVA